MTTTSPVILILMAVIALCSFRAFNDRALFDRLKFNVRSVRDGEYYRLLTAGFIHVDFNHLLFNGFTLYVFGDNALYGLGLFPFLILYFVSLLAGNLFAYAYHSQVPYYSAVGASGAIMGVVYASILMFPDMKLALIFLPIPFPAYVFGIGYLVYTLFGMKSNNDNIGHTAHLGGAIGGIATIVFFLPSVLQTSLITLVLMVVITLGFFFVKRN